MRNAISATNRSAPQKFRVAQYSIQGDHAHLIVEACDRASLVEGVRGLCIRIARRVNRLLARRGKFFADRWHGRALQTPRAVRHALVYVLANFRKHQPRDSAPLDVYSSAPYFGDFMEFPFGAPIGENPNLLPRALAPPPNPPVLRATTWLLAAGWKRHGKLSIRERPAS
ncbi:MAG TPA: hypothetical protein VG937_31005 [Polyangiaceae bacterium]|nr:hypothetical protein [Polyangiaceae bacterium]